MEAFFSLQDESHIYHFDPSILFRDDEIKMPHHYYYLTDGRHIEKYLLSFFLSLSLSTTLKSLSTPSQSLSIFSISLSLIFSVLIAPSSDFLILHTNTSTDRYTKISLSLKTEHFFSSAREVIARKKNVLGNSETPRSVIEMK